MLGVEMETCTRCKERWFKMDLQVGICNTCRNRDAKGRTPYLISVDNNMDPGEYPLHLPKLTQVEEMIIARSHVQMVIYRFRGHQYHSSGHCVSFMQDIVRTVDTLPNLPSDLNVVLLRLFLILLLLPLPLPLPLP